MKKLCLLTALAAVTALSACNPGGPTYITSSNAPMSQINVSATGKADVAPDRAIVTAGVMTQGKTAREAMIANATLMTAVYDELEAAGIPKSNVATSQLSLQPRFNYQNRRAPKIDGYDARNNVTVKADNLDKVGPMLDALVAAGVNNINGVQFTVKDPKAAKSKAREDAIREAKAQAQSMADAAGVKLGRLMSLSESGGYSRPQPMAYARMEMAADGGGASTPISAGEQTMSVTVNMSYAIGE